MHLIRLFLRCPLTVHFDTLHWFLILLELIQIKPDFISAFNNLVYVARMRHREECFCSENWSLTLTFGLNWADTSVLACMLVFVSCCVCLDLPTVPTVATLFTLVWHSLTTHTQLQWTFSVLPAVCLKQLLRLCSDINLSLVKTWKPGKKRGDISVKNISALHCQKINIPLCPTSIWDLAPCCGSLPGGESRENRRESFWLTKCFKVFTKDF